MEFKRIVRHTIPSKYDLAPFGTLCQANIGDDGYQLYIQLSELPEEAKWEPIGFLLEKAFEEVLQDEMFITELFHLIGVREYKSFKYIAKILEEKTFD